jgi:hypothetical protein
MEWSIRKHRYITSSSLWGSVIKRERAFLLKADEQKQEIFKEGLKKTARRKI